MKTFSTLIALFGTCSLLAKAQSSYGAGNYGPGGKYIPSSIPYGPGKMPYGPGGSGKMPYGPGGNGGGMIPSPYNKYIPGHGGIPQHVMSQQQQYSPMTQLMSYGQALYQSPMGSMYDALSSFVPAYPTGRQMANLYNGLYPYADALSNFVPTYPNYSPNNRVAFPAPSYSPYYGMCPWMPSINNPYPSYEYPPYCLPNPYAPIPAPTPTPNPIAPHPRMY